MTVCVTPYQGRRIRVVGLDECGRPLYGQQSTVTSSGFVSVELSAETEDGEDITQTNAAGETCISIPGKQTITYRTVTIEFCRVDPDLVTLINPSWKKVTDENGETIGWEETTELGAESGGYALELWMNVYTGDNNLCAGGGGGQGQWLYLLMPYVIGGVPQDLTIENAAVTFSYQGRTRDNNAWGRGPYPVAIVNGAPSRLYQPVSPNTPVRWQVVDMAPPRAQCGSQLTPRPAPEPAVLYLEGKQGQTGDQRMTVRARVDNHGFGPVMLSWGETGGTPVEVREGRWVEHTYSATGTYTITVNDKQTPSAYTVTREVTIPFPPDNPQLTVEAAADDPTRMTVTATWDNHGNGPVDVRFGDVLNEEQSTFENQDDAGSVSYKYPNAGVYTIEVEDSDQPTHISRATVSVPVTEAPEITNTTTSGLTATVTVNNHGNGLTTIDWGDNTQPTDGPNQGDASHTYQQAGTYTITVSAKGNELSHATTEVTVSAQTPAVTASPTQGDPMSVDLTVNNHSNGQVDVNWGDSQTGTHPGDGTVVAHTYATADAGEVTITATDPDTSSSANATAHPQPVPEISVAGTAPDATLTVNNHGHGATTVDWGDGSATEPGPGTDGGTVPHTFPATGGPWTITVTSDANGQAQATTQFPAAQTTGRSRR